LNIAEIGRAMFLMIGVEKRRIASGKFWQIDSRLESSALAREDLGFRM
jgi:hypothetical protein